MKLPYGVTGFYEKSKEPPKMDEKQFKQLCYTIMKNNGGKVLEFKVPQEATNFFDVEVNVFNKHLHILMNAHYPFLAFASDVNIGEVHFINEPHLYKQFSSFYYVLETKELSQPIVTEPHELNHAEWKQLAYWKPERIGDVIFNHWD